VRGGKHLPRDLGLDHRAEDTRGAAVSRRTAPDVLAAT